MAYHNAYCPNCGQKHVFQTRSGGTIRRCDNCGEKFPLPDIQKPKVVGCVIGLAAILILACCGAVLKPFLPKDRTSKHTISKLTRTERDAQNGIPEPVEPRPEPKPEPKEKTESKQTPKKKAELTPEQKASLDEEEAGRKLKLARMYYVDGKREAALERLREIIRDYPKTKSALQAREWLKEW